MAELNVNLGPYRLEEALEADHLGDGCFVIDVGRDEQGNRVESLKHIIKIVDDYLTTSDLVRPITKLYVIGDWNTSLVDEEHAKIEDSEGSNRPVHKFRGESKSEQACNEAVKKIATLVEQMTALKELTWIAGLPFMGVMWETLSKSLTKLVLDLGQPVRIEQDGDIEYKSYLTQTEMKPLVEQTELKELRLFRMHDSMQAVVWETIFRNVSESGVRVADLQMAAEPLVRMDHWHKAGDVVGLTVPKQDSNEKEYKGIEGKGVLHHSFGMGEYLDAFCMRKARIAAGLDETKPLPLWCLKLDGFVVDWLPFEHELSRIALLTCGNDCIDSGLRAPITPLTPHNQWSSIVNNAPSHCLIQWPNWTGVFDDNGDQRNNQGDIVSQETGLSTPVDGQVSPSLMPLTKESLELQELRTALEDIDKQGERSVTTPKWSSVAAKETPTSMASDVSVCGSDMPTPAVDPACPNFAPMATVDGFGAFGTTPPIGTSLVLVYSANTMVSTDSSFDHVSPVKTDARSESSTNGSEGTTTAGNMASKAGGFKHKVRQSLDWFAGSRSDCGDAA